MKTSERDTLAPQMAAYDDLADRGETRWLPYLMYFHRRDYRSAVVNTDRFGFRPTCWRDGTISPANLNDHPDGVKLLVGSSVVFGVGTSTDAASIPSRLSALDQESPWLNFGGRGYCSTQELLLFQLHRHLLPKVREVVIMGGLNDLVLAGLPEPLRSDYGGFFFCGDYYTKMDELRARYQRTKRSWRREKQASVREWERPAPSIDERVDTATEQISRNLDLWQPLVRAMDARLTYIAQPLATWVRDTKAAQEKALFTELDSRETEFWRTLFGATAERGTGERYADGLSRACEKRGIRFLDMNTALADAASPDQWLFVDRAHFNDNGYELVSRLIANDLGLV